MIKIYIGAERKALVIHRHLLCSKFPYFKSYFHHFPSQLAENSYQISEVNADAEIFSLVVEFVYRGSLEIFNPGNFRGSGSRIRLIISRAIAVYCFAAELLMGAMMEYIMDALVPIYCSNSLRPTVAEIKAAYRGTSEGNGLRRFMARSYQYITLTSPDPPEIIVQTRGRHTND